MKTNGSRRHLVGIIKALEARNAASDAMLAAAALHHGGEFFIPDSALRSIGDHTEFAVRSDDKGLYLMAHNPSAAAPNQSAAAPDLTMRVID